MMTKMRVVRVLVAEDNEDHLFLTTVALQAVQSTRVDVIPVRDGAEALDYMHGRGRFEQRELPHLVLLDLSMPHRSGLDVLEDIKGDPELSHVPVVVLTSSDRPEDISAAYGRGANSYVRKSKGLEHLVGFWAETVTLPNV